MKNKIIRYTLNGVILAAIAAIGVTAYQIGTSPTEENIIQESESEEYAMLENDVAENEDLDFSSNEDNSYNEDVSYNDEGVYVENSEDVSENQKTEEVLSEDMMDDELSEMNIPEEELVEETSVDSDLIDIVVPEEDWEAVEDTASETVIQQLHFSEETEMEWPVHGNILLDYNMDQTIYFPTLDQYKRSSAIAVQAVEGAPVMAAVSGMVYDISENAQTGTTVTMELGDGYQAIYGQLKDLTIEEGEMIEKGTVIGYISSPTKYYSVEGNNLYFSMKRNGEFVDPIEYLPE